ncbi:MAG: triose-phosphate isomerase [Nitrososphaerota archaeon]|nr:triose-phosphate isomerase [Nitrososphaerota archaeon]
MYPLDPPLLVINFKNYAEAQGEGSLRLAKAAEQARRETGVSIFVAPPAPSLFCVARSVDLPVLAQHVDAGAEEASTGHLPPSALKANGAVGSLVNHSERRLPTGSVEAAVGELGRLGMLAVVCARDPSDAALVGSFRPDAVAIEPPELIGGGRAVSKVAPGVVREGVAAVKRVHPAARVLCGAGITSGEDAAVALELGAEGVLVASAVVRSAEPRRVIAELAGAMR